MAGMYETYRLLAVQRKMKQLPAFFLQWFPQQINFQEDWISFDKVFQDVTRVAHYVAPNVEGRVIKEEGWTAMRFKPAYVKPKHVIDPNLIIPVQPGEDRTTGTLSLSQRRDRVIAYLLMKHRAMHENTWEMQAAQAVIDGFVDIEGIEGDYPKVRVDFQRDPSLTITTDWTANGVTPDKTFADLRAGKKLVNDKSVTSAVVTQYIFGGDAWALFASINKDRLWGQNGLMDRNIGGSETSVTRLWDGLEGVEYMGRIAGLNGGGAMEIYVNTQKYRDQANVQKYLFPQNKVMGISTAINGFRCFGAILDKAAGYQALEYFPKMYEQEDPSVEYLLTQGAPLMVPSDPNASFLITVMPASA